MTAIRVNGSGNGARSGAQTLALLAVPLNSLLLRAVATEPKQQAALRREMGSPAQTTLRAGLNRMIEAGVMTKHRRNRFPGALEYGLTEAGRDLLSVTATLDRWLANAPDGPLSIGSNAAKAAIRALTEGWSTTIVRALSAKPLSLTELDGVISSVSYPSLERRLGAMRLAGQITALPASSRGTPYTVTGWLREGMAPLAAAARWERRHSPQTTAPIGRHDMEAVFLLTVPPLPLPADLSGTCRMGAEIAAGGKRRLGGVIVEVERGRVTSCRTQMDGNPNAWILGPPWAWLSAMLEQESKGLELGGDSQLSRALLDGLHNLLISSEPPKRLDII